MVDDGLSTLVGCGSIGEVDSDYEMGIGRVPIYMEGYPGRPWKAVWLPLGGRRAYDASIPPLTSITWPVMKLPSSLANSR